jgi:hypothetical protein
MDIDVSKAYAPSPIYKVNPKVEARFPKRCYTPTRLYDITTQKTAIFTSMKT